MYQYGGLASALSSWPRSCMRRPSYPLDSGADWWERCHHAARFARIPVGAPMTINRDIITTNIMIFIIVVAKPIRLELYSRSLFLLDIKIRPSNNRTTEQWR